MGFHEPMKTGFAKRILAHVASLLNGWIFKAYTALSVTIQCQMERIASGVPV